MRFHALQIPGAFLVEPELLEDERGAFARTFCEAEFAAAGLVARFTQSSVSANTRRGTVRGMHWSADPHPETKLVRCVAGAIHDVVLDLRPGSPSFGRAEAVALSAENRFALYVPAGVAHGFQTLRDMTEVLYMIDEPFRASAARGLRWDDPSFRVTWPEPVTAISSRDRSYPDWPHPPA